MAYNAADQLDPNKLQRFSQENLYHVASPPPPQRVAPPPPPKVPPDYDQRDHQSDSSRGQQAYSSESLNEGQRQYERFQASQKDSVTYSIPSSIWRQDVTAARTQSVQPTSQTLMEHEEHNRQDGRLESQDMHGTQGSWHQRETSIGQPQNSGQSSRHSRHATAESVGWGENKNEEQRSDSFYWQSPHSSIHSTSEEDGRRSSEATPLDKGNDSQPNPYAIPGDIRSEFNDAAPPTLSHSTLGSYGASALGFGGPSDWEHFGDYEAEDIDDTDLYLRPKSPAKTNHMSETAELPAEPTYSKDISTEDKQLDAEYANDLDNASPVLDSAGKATDPRTSSEAVPPPHPLNYLARDESSTEAEDMQAEHSHVLPKNSPVPLNIVAVSSPTPDTPKTNAFSTDLDETIKAWSRAGSSENLIDTSSFEYNADQRPEGNHNRDLESLTVATLQSDSSKPPTATPPSSVQDRSEQAITPRPHDMMIVGDPTEKVDHDQQDSSGPRGLPNSLDMTSDQQPLDEASNSPVAAVLGEPDSLQSAPAVDQSRISPTKRPPLRSLESDDPFSGLDAWGKASLNRYIAMLREESQAKTDKEKFNIFTVFTTRETRLRAVLYDADQAQPTNSSGDTKTDSVTSPIKRASTTSQKRASKALPALPEDSGAEVTPAVNGHSRKPSKKISAAAVLGNPKPALQALDTANRSSTVGMDRTVDSAGDVQYSPGGRPVVSRPAKANNPTPEGDDLPTVTAENNHTDPSKADHNDAPKSNNFDQTMEKGAALYVAFKYEDGRSEAQNYAAKRLSKRQSVMRPYSKMMGSDEYRESFPNGINNPEDIPPIPTNDLVSTSNPGSDQVQLDLRRFVRADFDPLLTVLPVAGEVPPESLQLSDLRGIMESVPDDFSFIHQSVIGWDSKAKRQREINDRERHARQVESEQRIDALFDDHEIGYGDISELESGFKRSEAARKADEDRGEYQTFVSEVFDIVWTRLHYEIDQLAPHYNRHTESLDDTTAGKDMFDPTNDRFALAPTMDSLLTLHQKLEIRHQKAFEAVLERDRRLKKVELSPWYSLGNVAKVKQLEKQFEVAEKKAILDYCRQRDIRANSLMDHLDQNTLRGVGANQDYMEMVMKAVRRIASGRAFASQPGSSEPGVGLDVVTKAKSITKALSTSSEQIVQTFHVADMLLNAADYELSVAKARLEGADAGTLHNLKEEKAKEDQKLMRDLEHRLALIREDSRRTHDEIVKLLLFLGVQSGHASSSPSAAKAVAAADPHQERLQKALEEAKRRNAAAGVDGEAAV